MDMKVEETQEIDEILAKFTTLGNMLDIAFVMAEEFNAILNSCFGVFELYYPVIVMSPYRQRSRK